MGTVSPLPLIDAQRRLLPLAPAVAWSTPGHATEHRATRHHPRGRLARFRPG